MPKRSYASSGYELKRTKRVRPARSIKPNVKAMVQKIIRSTAEQKYAQVDSGASEFNINTLAAPQYLDLPNVNVGGQSNNRTGNKITTRALECRFTLHNNGTGNNSCAVRCMLLEVKGGAYQSNTNITNELFEPTNNGGQDTTWSGDLRDICFKTNREAFKVLKEEVIVLSGANSSSVGNGTDAECFRHWYVPNKKVIHYHDDTAAAQANVRYTMCFLARGMENDAANTDVECVAANGIYFTDV